MSDPLRTRFCTGFGVEHPIVQTGMGWVSGARLTAATSAAGGLGILAAVTLEQDAMVAAVRRVRSRTDRPFGVNLRPDQPDLPRRLDLLAQERVPVVSFAGGPPAKVVRRVHEAGLRAVVTVGRPRHAEKMLEAGADALLAQGGEGGGHTGDVATTLLLPAVIDLAAGSGVPVLAAGGFSDGRGLAAALVWGADGVAMGTRFLLTRESRVPDEVKQRYLAAALQDTVRSDAFDGAPMRVLRTEAVAELEARPLWRRLAEAPRQAAEVRRITGQSWAEVAREGFSMRRRQGTTLEQTSRAAQAPLLIRSALVEGDPVRGLLPTGQVAGNITDVPSVDELVRRTVGEARDALARLAG